MVFFFYFRGIWGDGATPVCVIRPLFSGSRLQTILVIHIPDDVHSLYWLKSSRDVWH